MRFLTFRGGVHPPTKKKLSGSSPITSIPLPERLFIPTQQHTGVPAQPQVKVKDYVYKGQKIGDAQSYITSPIHAPTS
ncbi:MAG: electron transporter RnfC, partial [Dictyoglomaceae bacterium]